VWRRSGHNKQNSLSNTRTKPREVLDLDDDVRSFICSCRNKIGAELHIYLEEGTYHKRLFRGPRTNDMKK
jgi:hypothetical protein